MCFMAGRFYGIIRWQIRYAMSSLTETFVILIHYALASPVVFLFFCLFMHFCLIKKKKELKIFLRKKRIQVCRYLRIFLAWCLAKILIPLLKTTEGESEFRLLQGQGDPDWTAARCFPGISAEFATSNVVSLSRRVKLEGGRWSAIMWQISFSFFHGNIAAVAKVTKVPAPKPDASLSVGAKHLLCMLLAGRSQMCCPGLEFGWLMTRYWSSFEKIHLPHPGVVCLEQHTDYWWL